ncbi:DNA cytosine methyltransferase [Clostridium sp.]|uniref:DNA cytosine methyltransferase n=1 Tax=Clostridium sp. TaxID=1506 RepID=UPI00262F067F|nr:DNA (cytosine-5-)-methyltransferase [uncultured Clostridium sp.]
MENRVCSLCSGCGGLDLGFIQAGFNVIWANDMDKYAVETYKANIGDYIVQDDINNVEIDKIPKHDILIAGFPCQPFSIMGKERGFEDHRGSLFFRICEIIDFHTPKIVVLENVGRLLTHKKGETYKIIKNELSKRGYNVFTSKLNSSGFGVPQTRNRLFIVCFKNKDIEFKFPEEIPTNIKLKDVLQKNVDRKYYLSEKIKITILSHGSGGYVSKPEVDLEIARPLCATMGKMHRAGQDNYVTTELGLRRLTPRECARLQGFDEDYNIVSSDFQAYKQFGNAVTVNVARAVAEKIKLCIRDE